MKALIYSLILIPICAFGASVWWVVANEPEAPPPPIVGEAPESSDPQIQRGWKVFTNKGCVYCHGAGALGGVVNPNAIGGTIPALDKVAQGYTKEELIKKIREGVKDTDISLESGAQFPPPLYMPTWKEKDLSQDEMDDLVAYLMSLAPEDEAW